MLSRTQNIIFVHFSTDFGTRFLLLYFSCDGSVALAIQSTFETIIQQSEYSFLCGNNQVTVMLLRNFVLTQLSLEIRKKRNTADKLWNEEIRYG